MGKIEQVESFVAAHTLKRTLFDQRTQGGVNAKHS